MQVKTTPTAMMAGSSGASGRRERETGSQTSLRWRALALTICLLVYIPLLLAASWAGVTLLRSAQAGPPAMAPAHAHMLKTIIGVYTGVLLITMVFFCLWLWRAARTVRRLGVLAQADRPGTAVMSFFIPIIWWYKPYATVRTIWQVAMNPNDWDNVAIAQSLPLWWLMWIGQWAAAVAVFGAEMVVMSADKWFLQIVAIWIFAGCGVVGAACLLAIVAQATAGLRRQLRNRIPVSTP